MSLRTVSARGQHLTQFRDVRMHGIYRRQALQAAIALNTAPRMAQANASSAGNTVNLALIGTGPRSYSHPNTLYQVLANTLSCESMSRHALSSPQDASCSCLQGHRSSPHKNLCPSRQSMLHVAIVHPLTHCNTVAGKFAKQAYGPVLKCDVAHSSAQQCPAVCWLSGFDQTASCCGICMAPHIAWHTAWRISSSVHFAARHYLG